jgi:WD40 repeat protein
MVDHVGEQIGNYRLLRPLGHGGFAEVYLGEHVYLKTLAAIKILHAHLVGHDAEQFLAEALMLVDLIHPNIVHIRDFAVQNGIPFLVMDYIPGGSLRQEHKNARLPLALIVTYVKQVAAALQYAHDKQFIHRDVKPENMLLGKDGEVILSDFGVAVVVQHQIAGSQAKKNVGGTPAYMAPEQIYGRPCVASDQYALGVTMYEWLCGELPFRGSGLHVLKQHKDRPVPSLREKNPAIPSEVEKVVLKALAKDPQQRFACVLDFANALEHAYQQVLAHDTVSRTTTQPLAQPALARVTTFLSNTVQQPIKRVPPRRRFLMVAGGVALTGGAIWGVSALYAHYHPIQKVPQKQNTTLVYRGHSGPVHTVAWSPDGRMLASGSSDTTVHIWMASTLHTTLTYRSHSKPVNTIAWSHDGAQIASGSSDGNIHVWTTGSGTTIFPDRKAFGSIDTMAWSPDSQKCAFGYDDIVLLLDANSGDINLVYTLHTAPIGAIAWSPDGTWVTSGDKQGRVNTWNVNTRETRLVANVKYAVRSLAWSPHGTSIAIGDGNGTITLQDATSGVKRPLGQRPAGILAIVWSPDSTKLASIDENNIVQIWDAQTGKSLGQYNGYVGPALAWSPNGAHIATCNTDNIVQIWDATNGNVTQTYKGHTHPIQEIAWSPDGVYIASGSDGQGVHIWDAMTGKPIRICAGPFQQIWALSWLYNGSLIAAGCDDNHIRTWDPLTGKVALTYGDFGAVHALTWSPRGGFLAVGDDKLLRIRDMKNEEVTTAYRDHARAIRAISWSSDARHIAEGGDNQVVRIWDAQTDGNPYTYEHSSAVNTVAWSPIGDRLVSGSADRSVLVWDMASNNVITTYTGHSASVNAVAWSPNGKHIASASDDGSIHIWDAATGTRIYSYKGHSGGVLAVAWSPDGMDVASGGKDATVQVWRGK